VPKSGAFLKLSILKLYWHTLNLKFFETAIEKLVKWTGAKSSAAKSSALVHMLNDRGGQHLCLPLIAL